MGCFVQIFGWPPRGVRMAIRDVMGAAGRLLMSITGIRESRFTV